MAQRKNPETKNEPSNRFFNANKWGVQDPGKRAVRLPSGTKLKFTEGDQLGILVFLGIKDISERVIDPETKEPKEQGSVLYYVFHDGRRIVNIAEGYALREYQKTTGFENDTFYLIFVADLVETGQPTLMKDLSIIPMGTEGNDAPVDKDYMGTDTIKLTLDEISRLNYNVINYPLRKV